MATNETAINTLRMQDYREAQSTGQIESIDGEEYYRIDNYDAMAPFFVTLTSPSDHWVFLSTSGGITAGRRNADNAIFPYDTVDKITERAANTGSATIIFVRRENQWVRWEPFNRSYDGVYDVSRSVIKSVLGNRIIFEETNVDLGLLYRLCWTTSPTYGLIKQSALENLSDHTLAIRVLDGIQNTLPAAILSSSQLSVSCLLDAYKRCELDQQSGLGIFSLSSVLSDIAEPSEALLATTWWQAGLDPQQVLLSSHQLDSYRRYGKVSDETDIKGRRGSYLVTSELSLDAGACKEWFFCGEVNQSAVDLTDLARRLSNSRDEVASAVLADIDDATAQLRLIFGSNDGLQTTGDATACAHHLANLTYNVMRGGYFAFGYEIPSADLAAFTKDRNRPVAERCDRFLQSLPETIPVSELIERGHRENDSDLIRLIYEYLPVTFSRRHGDPSRPWNAFSIETQAPDGSLRLAYQGNWRDIFQNWEALLTTSPVFVTHVIAKFLNATTCDGYNPYRISRDGIDWETPEPDNPWANIGYWSDHQIIYLQKLLELAENYMPGALLKLMDAEIFSYADIPYEIKGFAETLVDPFDTITFNVAREEEIRARVDAEGSDGRLLHDAAGTVVHTNMIEKLIVLLLAKVTNLVPNGGIWMNTQRPEWNDANNALVGKGVSVVTLAYLERFTSFLCQLVESSESSGFEMFEATATWFDTIRQVVGEAAGSSVFTPAERLRFMQRCGLAGEQYRSQVYARQMAGSRQTVRRDDLLAFLSTTADLLRCTLQGNRRDDGLYHSYNTLRVETDGDGTAVGIELLHLYEMLEGQVAAISSSGVDPETADGTLAALRESAIYRDDQKSYMLYPNRNLPGFLQKNVIPENRKDAAILQKLQGLSEQSIVLADIDGNLYFSPEFRNAGVLAQAIETIRAADTGSDIDDGDVADLLSIYEDTFHHQAFTGRSGTFFGYEGLGSVYWHMVSKLLLAAQESAVRAHRSGNAAVASRLRGRYFDIRAGIGFAKTPAEYGAFPPDPYSHTPINGGAKQPGMTGQVKEELLTRFAELGLYVETGCMIFDPFLVREEEYLSAPDTLSYVAPDGSLHQIALDAGSFAFTFCQTPVVVSRGKGTSGVVIHIKDGSTQDLNELTIPSGTSAEVFGKTGVVVRIEVRFGP